MGEDERSTGQVTVKNMESGVQAVIPRDQLAGWLTASLRALSCEP
jgi:histidyl-tRNA synthetase